MEVYQRAIERMCEMMSDVLQQEIRNLELQLEDLFIAPDRRRTLEIEIHFLRNGYRILPIGLRILGIQNRITGQIVYETTDNELRYARMTKQSWLEIIQKAEKLKQP
jgi:hypothetical protein